MIHTVRLHLVQDDTVMQCVELINKAVAKHRASQDEAAALAKRIEVMEAREREMETRGKKEEAEAAAEIKRLKDDFSAKEKV